MSQIILDMGSGNGCRNDWTRTRDILDSAIEAVSGEHPHEIIFKFQLFHHAPPNVPLDPRIFKRAYYYARRFGYSTTSSVFDANSLHYLMGFREIPFIKVACNPKYYCYIDFVPRRMAVYVSFYMKKPVYHDIRLLCCVPEYPAAVKDYTSTFMSGELLNAISDHTVGFELYRKYRPKVWEKHYVLDRDPSNPDAGEFAIEPKELKEFLEAEK